MRIKEFVDDAGYFRTLIATESEYETKIAVRAVYKNPDKFSRRIDIPGSSVKPSRPLPDKLSVFTAARKDVRLEEALKFLRKAKEEVDSLQSFDTGSANIQETVILFTEKTYEDMFEERLGRIGVVLTTFTYLERRLNRLICDSGLASHSYVCNDGTIYNIFVGSNGGDLRIESIKDILLRAKEEVSNLRELSEKWTPESPVTSPKTVMSDKQKASRKVRI